MTALPIKSIKIPKENNASACVCFVELYTTHEASQIYALLSTLSTGFVIDDAQISICYAKRNLSNSNAMNAGGLKNAASVALAAAQWTNQSEAGQPFQRPPAAGDPQAPASSAANLSSNIQIVVPFNAPGKHLYHLLSIKAFYPLVKVPLLIHTPNHLILFTPDSINKRHRLRSCDDQQSDLSQVSATEYGRLRARGNLRLLL